MATGYKKLTALCLKLAAPSLVMRKTFYSKGIKANIAITSRWHTSLDFLTLIGLLIHVTQFRRMTGDF